MLHCGNCEAEYHVNDDHEFCTECGTSVRTIQSNRISPPANILNMQSRISDLITYHQPGLTSELTGISEGLTVIDIGDRITNVYYSINGPIYCAYGGERLGREAECFRCTGCNKDPICVDHFDNEPRLCQSCS